MSIAEVARSSAGREPETIAAVSSGAGKAAIAIVRLSGPRSRFALEMIAGGVPEPRRAALRTLTSSDPEIGEIDRAVVLWLPSPSTYTGEDMAEFHVHGGRGVTTALMRTLLSLSGVRLADPGEFTLRAFKNGQLDLTEAESVADLIDSETEQQRKQALRQLEGALAEAVLRWRNDLLESCALAEAGIDFADETDVATDALERAIGVAHRVRTEITAVLEKAGQSRRIKDGFQVVLAGPPNAGKSTLLNALARREVAITSTIPGTTRDAIEVHLDLDGYAVCMVDTAGIRESADALEALGVARAKERMANADLVIWLSPKDDPCPPAGVGADTLVVQSKSDLAGYDAGQIRVSSTGPPGVEALVDAIRSRVAGSGEALGAIVTRERHRGELASALARLDEAVVEGRLGQAELVAENLRRTLNSLGRIIGAVDVEDILGSIFSTFCIGK